MEFDAKLLTSISTSTLPMDAVRPVRQPWKEASKPSRVASGFYVPLQKQESTTNRDTLTLLHISITLLLSTFFPQSLRESVGGDKNLVNYSDTRSRFFSPPKNTCWSILTSFFFFFNDPRNPFYFTAK